MTKVAVLDDYQSVAHDMADWNSLPEGVSIDVFQDHLSEDDDVASRLAPYDIVVAMRERTPFQRSLLERLPNLRLLVTTGMRNASIDVAAANDHGITVCGTDGVPYATAELTWGLILALLPQDSDRRPRDARRPVAGHGGRRTPRQDPRRGWARQARLPGCNRRSRIRHEPHRMEPEPDRRNGPLSSEQRWSPGMSCCPHQTS